jgi:phosphatidylinositol alpha 1,6-mannosyltransferase
MKTEPRVAFFPDSLLEVNGVAHTSRQLVAYAQRQQLPLLCVHGGAAAAQTQTGSVTQLTLARSRWGFRLDADFRYDLLFWRHARRVLAAVRDFRAEVIHLTGPNDTGQLGAFVAWQLGLPLVVSWHTNVHEYAGARLARVTPWLPRAARQRLSRVATAQSLRGAVRFYQLGRVLLAPNEELCTLLRQATGRPVQLMRRGVDTKLFSPLKRLRTDSTFLIGYVGRLTPEKNVRLLVTLDQALRAAGIQDFRLVIVGEGSERGWLEQHLPRATFTGVLRGEALARAYANFDLFVFPSETDTFGNVVLEAQAAGVPALVSVHGGPKFILKADASGLLADHPQDFVTAVLRLYAERPRSQQMRVAARQRALEFSWDKVFSDVYQAYAEACRHTPVRVAAVEPPLSTLNLKGPNATTH